MEESERVVARLSDGATQINGNHLITTTAANFALCVIAAAGNSSALTSAADGTTNAISSTVTIRQVA